MQLRFASLTPVPESFGRIKIQSMTYDDVGNYFYEDAPLDECSDEEVEQMIEFMLSRGFQNQFIKDLALMCPQNLRIGGD